MAAWRRAAVGVGGGAMVGVGSILMVTPLHPVGHAMALGGVGVLGTEFEGPRRFLQSMRGTFQRRRKSTEDDATVETFLSDHSESSLISNTP